MKDIQNVFYDINPLRYEINQIGRLNKRLIIRLKNVLLKNYWEPILLRFQKTDLIDLATKAFSYKFKE